jgi:hypothetical protein
MTTPSAIDRDAPVVAHHETEIAAPQSGRLPRRTPIAASKLRPNSPPQLVGDGLRAFRRGVEGVMVEPFRLFWSNLVLAPGFHGKEGVNGSSPLEGFVVIGVVERILAVCWLAVCGGSRPFVSRFWPVG